MEFDLFDKEREEFLDTERRRQTLRSSPVVSVPVLRRGAARTLPPPAEMVSRSLFKGPGWRDRLREQAEARGLDVERAVRETDGSDDAEGLYVKVEEGGRVVDRLKWIRQGFLTSVAESDSHWLHRPILPNRLKDGVDLFAP